MKNVERVGKRYNMLVVDSFSTDARGNCVFRCMCDCGGKSNQAGSNLGKVVSCGCHKRSRTTNKVCDTPEYAVWEQMNQRCYNERSKAFKNYGGRGITVYAEWRSKPRAKDASAFLAFFAHVGPRPPGDRRWSIERKNNAGNYEPGNVVWAITPDQNRNKRTNHKLTFRGETLCLADWAKRCGMSVPTIIRRLNEGWSVKRTLTTRPAMRGRAVWAANRVKAK